MGTTAALLDAFDDIAPAHLAEPWDNAGLILGHPEDPREGSVFLAIDLTTRVTEEALDANAAAVVIYHPPIFHPIKRLDASDRLSANILRLARAGVAIYSPHTAIDNAANGLNDWLSSTLGSGDRRALRLASEPGPQRIKVVTFVPEEAVERVRMALASAGAGRIGNYELCSFNVHGTGTFLPGESAKPAVGSPGQLEHAPEIRLEMVCPARAEAIAVETLRELHPYEEPAIDVYDLRPQPARASGAGRRITLDQPATILELAERVKEHLGVNAIKIGMPSGDESKPIRRVGVCAGSGASLADDAIDNECDVFFTGEMTHHEVLGLLRKRVGVILAGHTNTERPYLAKLAERLREKGIDASVSRVDRSSLRVV